MPFNLDKDFIDYLSRECITVPMIKLREIGHEIIKFSFYIGLHSLFYVIFDLFSCGKFAFFFEFINKFY